MRYLIILCTLLLSCSKHSPPTMRECNGMLFKQTSLPIPITIDAGFTQVQAMQIALGFQMWNDALGVKVFEIQSEGVRVVPKDAHEFKPNEYAHTRIYYYQVSRIVNYTEIRFNKARLNSNNLDLAVLSAHEAGHALGLGHIEGTIMRTYHNPHETIDQSVVDSVRCAYDL